MDPQPQHARIDLHKVASALLAIVVAILGWLATATLNAVQELQRNLSALEVRLNRDFPSYDRLSDTLKPISAQLQRIEEAVGKKADK